MDSFRSEQGYLQLLRDVLQNGERTKTRNGYTISSFGKMISFNDIDNSFPLLTSKKMFIRGIIEELLWFLRGSTDANELKEKNVKIWNGNSSREYLDSVGLSHYKEGELGPVYGWQWRSFGKPYKKNNEVEGFDQLRYAIEELLKPENSRRSVISGWNPLQLHEMALPPCHILYVFYKNSKGLHCSVSMRSTDLFLGLPFNIASAAILTHIIAKILHIKPCAISINMTDSHIYEEHIESVNKQIENDIFSPPQLMINKEAPSIGTTIEEKIRWINDLCFEDFVLQNYNHNDVLTAVMK